MSSFLRAACNSSAHLIRIWHAEARRRARSQPVSHSCGARRDSRPSAAICADIPHASNHRSPASPPVNSPTALSQLIPAMGRVTSHQPIRPGRSICTLHALPAHASRARRFATRPPASRPRDRASASRPCALCKPRHFLAFTKRKHCAAAPAAARSTSGSDTGTEEPGNGKQGARVAPQTLTPCDAATWTCSDYNQALPPRAQLSRGAVSGDVRTLDVRAAMRSKPTLKTLHTSRRKAGALLVRRAACPAHLMYCEAQRKPSP